MNQENIGQEAFPVVLNINVIIIFFIAAICFIFGCSQFNGKQLLSSYENMPLIVEISKIKTHQVPYDEIGKYHASTITIVKGSLKIVNNFNTTKLYDIRDIYLLEGGYISKSGEINSVIDYLYEGELSPGASVSFPLYWIFEDKLEFKEDIKLEIFIFKDLKVAESVQHT